MLIELHKTEIELVKRMMKIIEILKLEPHRYTIQLREHDQVNLKLHDPTVWEHKTLLAYHGLPTIRTKISLFTTTAEYQTYEFTYPDMTL